METVAQIKLREIQKQRKRLLELFDLVSIDAELATTPKKKLEILLQGVLKKKYSLGDSAYVTTGDNVHHLEVLLKQCEFSNLTSELLGSWVEKLQREIHYGRAQTEFAYLYGSILQEWAADTDASRVTPDDEDYTEATSHAPTTAAAAAARSPSLLTPDDLAEKKKFLDRLEIIFKKSEETSPPSSPSRSPPASSSSTKQQQSQPQLSPDIDLRYLRDLVKRAEEGGRLPDFGDIDAILTAKVSSAEIKAAATALCGDNLVNSAVKKVLKGVLVDEVLVNEYAGVLTIMAKNFTEWNWPAGAPLKLKVAANRNGKWRAFVDEDIVTALFLQVVGARWGAHLREHIARFWGEARQVDYYSQMYSVVTLVNSQSAACLPQSSVDTTNQGGDYEGRAQRSLNGQDWPSSSSSSEMPLKQKILQLLAAEVKGAVDLGKAVTVVCSDVENFYPSISHKVVFELLRLYRCPPAWVQFVEKFMTPTLTMTVEKQQKQQKQPGEQQQQKITRQVRRGLLTGHALSKVLHEMIMFLADFATCANGGVGCQRNFDDIYFWGSEPSKVAVAWQSLNEFMTKTGMALNLSKSGHVFIRPSLGSPSSGGGNGKGRANTAAENPSRLPGLPVGPVIYGLICLRESGQWQANEPLVKAAVERMGRKLATCKSLFSWVRVYNSSVKFMLRLLGDPCHALGVPHVASVSKVMASIHNEIEGVGVIKHLQSELLKRFQERNMKVTIPEAWFYWPITAGGLGVYNPFLTLSATHMQLLKTEKSNKFVDEKASGYPLYRSMYSKMLSSYNVINPALTTELEGRITDFTRRGSNLRGRRQTNLTAYWQWLLCNYGHQIVETVGTLEFTDPELVPLALIQGVEGE